LTVTAPEQQRRLAAIMFTDMVGYSALSQRSEADALDLLDEHNRLLRPLFSQFHGKEIKTVGDAFLVEFASALDATKCAIAMQRGIHQRNTAGDASHAEPMHIRIGIHVCDVVYRDGDVFGDGVNIAARIESAAPADGICVSEDVARQVQNKLDVALVNLGHGKLKNIELPVDIYAVQLPWLAVGIHAAPAKRVGKRNLLIALPLCLLLVTGGWWFWPGRSDAPEHSPSASASPSIAVLPFVDMSQDKDQAYFSDGLSEELLNLLARVPQLKVIARTSSFSFRGKEADVATIAHALNVSNVLEGSVRKSADRIRITAQLIRASDSSHIWSQAYERKLTDIFSIQDEIANAVVEALKIKLLPEQRASSANHYVPNPAAYDQYLLGRQLMIREQSEALSKALEALHKAVEIDPNYAAAYSNIGMVESFLTEYSNDPAQRAAAQVRAINAAEKAIALDPLLGEGYATRGFLRYFLKWDWAGADADLRRAIELDANDAKTPLKYCLLQSAMGDLDNALRSARRATELDPMFSPPWAELARIQGATGDYAAARRSIEHAISITPENVRNKSFLAVLSILEGDPAKAREYYLQERDELTRLSGLAVAELALGNTMASQRAYEAFVARAPGNVYFAAIMHTLRGENDAAFAKLETLYAAHSGVIVRLRTDPLIAKLRDDPRFDALLVKAGLPPLRKPA
jgi:TolB-like protein/class 3 adenylate cyclase/Flp pilus assembly protein TadD